MASRRTVQETRGLVCTVVADGIAAVVDAVAFAKTSVGNLRGMRNEAESSDGRWEMGASDFAKTIRLRLGADCRERLGPGVSQSGGWGWCRSAGPRRADLAGCGRPQVVAAASLQCAASLAPPRGISKVPGHPIQNCASAVPRRSSPSSPHRAAMMLNLKI